MAITAEQTKSLIRLQGALVELQKSLEGRQTSNAPLREADRQLAGLMQQVYEVVQGADPTAGAELLRLMESSTGSAGVAQRLAAISGWVRGAIEATVFERRLAEEARAYADARIRAERPFGFGQPDH